MSPRVRRERLDPMVRRIGIVTVLGSVMSVLDTMVVNVALDSLSRKLHTDISTIQWVVTSYLLALAATLPISAWAARRIGVKRLYMLSLLIFTIGSGLCGLAWSAESLIAFRVLQGIGGGMIIPVGQMIIVRAAGKENLGRVMGVLSTPTIIAPIVGPTLGGLLLQAFGWQSIFLINLPGRHHRPVFGQRVLPADEPESGGQARRHRLRAGRPRHGLADLRPLGDREHGGVLGLKSGGVTLAGVVLLSAFVHESLHSTTPLLNLHLFRIAATPPSPSPRSDGSGSDVLGDGHRRRSTSSSYAVRTPPTPPFWWLPSPSAWCSWSVARAASRTASAAVGWRSPA